MGLIDDARADDYIGKIVLIGMTYLDHEEKLIEQKQWVGTIAAFSRKDGIKIKLRDSGELFGLAVISAPSQITEHR